MATGGGLERSAGRYLGLRDRLLPFRHPEWWNWDASKGQTRRAADLLVDFQYADPADAEAALEHVQEVAQTAVERAAAADRRASTVAGSVAIAASFTLSAAGLILDKQKFGAGSLRTVIAVVVAATTVAFVVSAWFALRALITTRYWRWTNPHHLDEATGKPRQQRCAIRSAHLLDDFAFNWEVSVQKNHLVDNALAALVLALGGIATLAILLAIHVA